MLEKFEYVNSVNDVLDFGASGIYVNENDLRDFAWETKTRNNRITSFSRGITKKKLPIIIYCGSEEQGITARNHIFEIAEKDVLRKQHGRLTIGDYSLKCYVIGSAKTEYLASKRYMKATLEIVTDYPFWYKEESYVFNMKGTGTSVDELDYPYDYPHDYLSEVQGDMLSNLNFTDSNFRLTIYGFATDPIVYVDDHVYSVNVTISTGEYLTIDTREKTIVLTRYNGAQMNCYHLRNKESYVFEKISPGNHIITCAGELEFEITMLDERSEPKWT